MATETEVRERLLGILAGMLEEPPKYQPGADIFEDFGLDSLDQIEFLFSIEQQFGVKIIDDTFEEQGLRQFDRLAAYLVEQQAGNSDGAH
jgi:acyl carrier protein